MSYTRCLTTKRLSVGWLRLNVTKEEDEIKFENFRNSVISLNKFIIIYYYYKIKST